MPSCGDCHWWKQYDNGRVHTRVGVCKRMPPTATEFHDPHPIDDRAHRGRALWPVLVE